MRLMNVAAIIMAAVLMNGCAGATIGSGVGDQWLERAPWYGGQIVEQSSRIGHFPITYQRGGSHEPMFDPKSDAPAVAALLREMNAYLDSLGLTSRIDPAGARGTPVDVQFGCETVGTGECEFKGNDKEPMRLAVARPSGEWSTWTASALQSANVDLALVLTLEVGQYWPRQVNWRGSKEVELGTGYALGLPWLTSLETPVTVLQITGALVAPDGRAVRMGAEGMLARRTNLVLSSMGVQRVIDDSDVQELRTARRDDLEGKPLVWQTALRNLVAGLTGRR
jgi:hypothetical protein